ncbi:hypothetical protein ACWT_5770 [Actinoplanes sp. SE50]|uniref:NUDIX domain-containing protein n=1 Tax=unclassified Actinoplanes TaxID=2626549 RepID=UPI00023ED67F|nr:MULTISPECIES: NUDIX domain-containing protein [unclassified Actinoplanes]AEV86788.1 hypothetical protein ACPL_5901 [Actinoplanes sp. SE50/110]ATO85185.1 hypothetical protein ACWT_5770 [Actinoplanes sp. SE50]SLM02595.1 hypothetical protein ACSP50_5877 [Actinoplanes sp. SE50/110]
MGNVRPEREIPLARATYVAAAGRYLNAVRNVAARGVPIDPGDPVREWTAADAAAREIREELGLDLSPGRLLVVDWVPAQPDGRPPLANYIFDGGQLTADQLHNLRLPADELTAWQLTTAAEWPRLLAEHLVRRLHACAHALATNTTAYLNHGWHPTDPT